MNPCLTATVSRSALRHNLELLRKRAHSGTLLCPAVKADCYGHGLDLLLPVFSELADWLCVATPDEALDLRRRQYRGPLLAFFSACALPEKERDQALQALVEQDVTQTLVAAWEIEPLRQAAQKVNRPAPVQIKVDTGMYRSGVLLDDALELLRQVRACEHLQLTGIYTHYASADDDPGFTAAQTASFDALLAAAGPLAQGLARHAANSAALLRHPETHYDIVRPGIAVYGYVPFEVSGGRPDLRPLLRLCAPLLQIKDVPAGAACGYGLTHRFEQPARLGRVPVGYGDGYPRCLSNRAQVRLRGIPLPIRGRVSMDQILVDLTEVPDAKPGEEIEIISDDPHAPNSIEALARLADTIPYEITCRLGGPRLRRIAVD